jgi:hypothetical protein
MSDFKNHRFIPVKPYAPSGAYGFYNAVSFRAEAYGFLAGISLLVRLHTIYNPLTHKHHTIHTDSASLLSQLQKATDIVPVGFWLKTDSDVVRQIVAMTKQVQNLERVYVKGHQEEKKKRSELTQPELFNIDAAASATQMRYETTQPADMVIHFSTSVADIYIRNQHISASPSRRYSPTSTIPTDYWAYIETKFQWTTQTRKLIEWDMYHTTLKAQPTLQQKQLLKYISNWLPTGREMHRNDENEDHRCPHCHTIQETNQHILRCPHPERRAKREQFLRVMLNNLYRKSNTAQPLRELISQNLLQWF